jgi:hypothetical protein
MKEKRKVNPAAVSLFVVIFATLLITIVTVSFVRIMIKGQQQATSTDLSQSAYDSALAGVEDAKRALLRYEAICNSGDAAECAATKSKINLSTCNTAVTTLEGIQESAGEVKVETGGGNSLNQAYTCVKVKLDTPDYLGYLDFDEGKLIPLAGDSAFDSITIEWFNMADLGENNTAINLPALGLGTPLFAKSNWLTNRPPIIKAQLMQFSSNGFLLSDFNNEGNLENNTDTLFLYPSMIVASPTSFGEDNHKQLLNSPVEVNCKSDIAAVTWACSATITLPRPIGLGNRNAFLNLTALYNKTHYHVVLSDSATNQVVKFNAVQPEVDSTGRANDLFRRVLSRIEMRGMFPYPEAAVDTNGNLCKDFLVTDSSIDYDDFVSPCKP